MTGVNFSEHKINPLDDIDTQIKINIDVAIRNCKYYDSQKLKSISSNNNFSLSFCNINSLNANFENYFLSYLSDSNFIPNVLAFCETRCISGCEQLYSLPEYYSKFVNKTGFSDRLVLFIRNYMSCKFMNEPTFMSDHLEF